MDFDLDEVYLQWTKPGADSDLLYIDAVKVTTVPLPGSLSILALSAAALALRRRKRGQ
jgi:uncharacterized protein (TIGR03382 family)